jgi:Rrf2 family protein
MITREADYAARVMILLARREGQGLGGASSLEIAGEMEIPYRFLRKLVKRMVAGKLLRTRRGKGGGLGLARPAERISLFDILEVMTPTGTRLSLCVAKPEGCRRAGTCRLHRAFGTIQASMDRQMRAVTLASLVE